MRIDARNWLQIEEYLQTDDRCVVPLGCTEQHAYLSLSTDSILAERIAVEAAEPLGIPVFPVVPYGLTPSFGAYPGTVTLSYEVYGRVLVDLTNSLYRQGFQRILFVNGHGGNTPARAVLIEWLQTNPGARLLWHDWWNAPKTLAAVHQIDPVASHASWMENFPWTRLPDTPTPDFQKPMIALSDLRPLDVKEIRERLGDGNFGGYYQRSDEDMQQIWSVAIEETRALLEDL